jgi:lactoylglutathione lyase
MGAGCFVQSGAIDLARWTAPDEPGPTVDRFAGFIRRLQDAAFGASFRNRLNGVTGMPVVPVSGLFEAHLTVSDLDRSIAFYRDVVGLELAHVIPSRHVAFFWIGAPGAAMLGLWSIHSSPLSMRLHIAFRVTLQQVEASIEALRTAGLVPLSGFGRQQIEEPVVLTWMPAASVYFDDPDGHSLEYICMRSDPPRADLVQMKLSEWRALNDVG